MTKATNFDPLQRIRAAKGYVDPIVAASTVGVSSDVIDAAIEAATLKFIGADVEEGDDRLVTVTLRTGIKQLLNNSGADIGIYQVVVNDPTADNAFTTTTTAQESERAIGVTQAAIAAGDIGPVMFAGETPIQLTAAGTRGTFVETSATAGEAGTNATRRAGSFGVLVEGADPADATLTGLADQLIDSAVTQSTVAGTSINATMPATVPIGTLLILSLWLQGTASSPTISGWTRIGSTSGFRYYTRVADGTEGSTVAISWTGSSQAVVSVLVLDGIDTGSPVAGFDYDSTTGAASVSGLTSASYLALAAVNALAAVPDAWTVLGSGSAGSGGGTASIVQSAHAGPFSSFGGTLNLPSPVTPGNLLVLVEAGGNYFSHNDLNLSPSAGGSARPFTAFTPNVATSDSFGDDQMAMAYRAATGDEQSLFFSGETENFHVFVYEIANAGDPTGFEVRHLSHQAAASTKSLGAFGTAGDVQLMGMIVAETATDQTVGTGYTQDLQVTIAKPTFVVAHDTAGHTPQISGASHEWAGIAVGITGASSLVQGEIVGQLFAGTGATSPFTGASAQDDALIVLALAITPFVSVPVARALLWGGDPDLSDGSGGFDGVAEDLTTSETDTTKRLAPDGAGGVDWVAETSGSLPWFNVKDYGAVGDGTTDDTSAVNLAIAALIATGFGVLYFPAGTYLVSSTLTTLSVPCLVLGDSRGDPSSNAVSQINFSSTSTTLFSVSVAGVSFSGLAMNQTGGTATAGSCITTTGGTLAAFTNLSVRSFYLGIDIENSNIWTMQDCYIATVSIGLKVRNTSAPDTGDWSVVNTNFAPTTGTAIRVESSGGGRVANVKVNGGASGSGHGIDYAIGAGVSTSVLLITNCSIENIGGDGIRVVTSSTGAYSLIAISNVQFGLYSNTSGSCIRLTANTLGEVTDVVLDNILARSTGGNANPAIVLTKIDKIRIGAVINDGFGSIFSQSGCTNVTDDTAPFSGTFATPSILLGTAAAAGAASSVISADATIAAFDATAPVTQALGDAAATGSAAFAARRDHKHGMPALSTATPLVESGSGSTGTATASSREDHVHPASASAGQRVILLADGHANPFAFTDCLQKDDGSDFMWSDP